MKNEDLFVYKKSDFYEDFISSQNEYYEREQVDTLLAEKDREIAELKKKLMPCLNGDCILTCEVVEKYGKENAELKAAIRIKDKLLIENGKQIGELKGELESRRQAAIDIKLSAEKVLRDLLDCGLIKEWYFNGKFNAVLKADDPHLQIAELKAENKLLKEHIANGDVSRITWIDEVIELKQKLESVQASMYCDVVDANMENRKLRRALWLTRAKRALEKIAWFKLWNCNMSTMNPEDGARQEYDKWMKNLGKFLKKAEEYK